MPGPDSAYYREQSRRYRRLSEQTVDPLDAARLARMAADLDVLAEREAAEGREALGAA